MVVYNNNSKNPNNNANEDNNNNLVYGVRLSSVGSAAVTPNLSYEPNNMDLAMKLHYLRVVYFLDKQEIEGISSVKWKEAIFAWLCYYYESCGRFRRSENDINNYGRPYIKCNDCGVRFVEAKSSKTLEDWLNLEEFSSSQRLLVADNVLGPELTFSPLVFLQITSLKCGGIALGLSWAHVLGDAKSASNYMNLLALFLRGTKPNTTPNFNKSPPQNQKPMNSWASMPRSLRKVGPFGDHWIMPLPCEMDTFSFHVRPKQLAQLQMKLSKNDSFPSPIQPFVLISAVIWRAIARVKSGPEPNTVTVVKKDTRGPIDDPMILRNNQIVGSVKANFSVAEAHLEELVALMHDTIEDERDHIGHVVGQDPGGSDFIIYGSNLTFVDMEEADFYGFEVNGLSPRFVNCFIDGIGEEGVVQVLPSPKDGKNDEDNMKLRSRGRIVTLVLPKTYMKELKVVLKECDLIA